MSEDAFATKSKIEEISWDPHTDDFWVTLISNDYDKCFVVVLSREQKPGFDETDTIENKWLDELQGARDDDEKESNLMNNISNSIQALSEPVMRDLAPSSPNQKLDLHTCLNPPTFTFQVATVNGTATLIRRTKDFEDTRVPKTLDIASVKTDLPLINSTDIEVVKDLYSRRVFKVLVNGQERCCKIAGTFFHDSIQREFDALQQILDADIQVPHLKGIVKGKNGDLIGIITEYIDSPERSLALVDVKSTPTSEREKWATQIRDTVHKLHDHGVVWGDAKTDNVLIDKNGDAWIIDFGGGQTRGWISKGLAGTQEGDLEAVKKIIDVLQV
ncbi:hypothetical protein K505DRAFT_321552 [Melanomma pulvis-pyrius CBS 109.77]|uniref:Protein kinase domain-containing protein n=1 Tax=Melanomma pulvis-pyrius CBS 109.77 TaxID=1314802 RepID=A0A6A6XTN2_9PLEO|nr:hypothetical protein K505DRAFT_321552 [Melanomma pulvis-pyrius CBS 109.77]